MRVLVLGGTRQLSRAVAAEAVARGHEVVCACRGRSGAIPDGARLVEVDRDVVGGFDALAGEAFDAVVDFANVFPWVPEALRVLGANAGHWTFVSSINAYADTATPGQSPGAPLHEPVTELEFMAETPEAHGGAKVAAENAVRESVGGRAFVVRPGVISGPDDGMDRFGYWAARFARGGRAVVPDVADQPIQHVDARDLASWIVEAGEQCLTGTYDAVGPVTRLGALLADVADLTAGEGTELVPVSPAVLAEANVNPWGGPKSLPLWLPETHHGLAAHDPSPALGAGLRIRPLVETVHAALERERALGFERSRVAGLTPDEEADVLNRV